jgi:ankyrin repeat protein
MCPNGNYKRASMSHYSHETIHRFNLLLEALDKRSHKRAKEHVLFLQNIDNNTSRADNVGMVRRSDNEWMKLTDRLGSTALHILCQRNQSFYRDNRERDLMLEVASNILSASSLDVFYMEDERGNTPFHYICGNNFNGACPALARLIFDHCRPFNILKDLLIHKQNCHGTTPLHFLAGNIEFEPSLCQKILEDCSDSNEDNSCSKFQQEIVVTDNDLDTPLHIAASTFSAINISYDYDDDSDDESFTSSECYDNQDDNTLLLLQQWIQFLPSAVVKYNYKGHLPIEELICSYIDNEIDSYGLSFQPHQKKKKKSKLSTNQDFFYYCNTNKLCLTTQAVQQISQDLWPKMLLFLRTTHRVLLEQQCQLQRSSSKTNKEEMEDSLEMSGVHLVAACNFLPVIVLVCATMRNPNAVFQPSRIQGKLPLHYAVSSLEITNGNETRNPCTENEAESIVLSLWNNNDHTTYSSLSMDSSDQSQRSVCSHSMIQYLLELNQDAANAKSKNDQLPLHLACENGSSWKDINLLLQASPNTISQQDGPSGLFPFMLAAANENNTVDVVLELLLFNPELVSRGSEKRKY